MFLNMKLQLRPADALPGRARETQLGRYINCCQVLTANIGQAL